jgi:hypothetical protein
LSGGPPVTQRGMAKSVDSKIDESVVPTLALKTKSRTFSVDATARESTIWFTTQAPELIVDSTKAEEEEVYTSSSSDSSDDELDGRDLSDSIRLVFKRPGPLGFTLTQDEDGPDDGPIEVLRIRCPALTLLISCVTKTVKSCHSDPRCLDRVARKLLRIRRACCMLAIF